MTDKELRKLSRLELLELLLEASKENKKLKEEIDRLQDENKTAHNIENLSVVTRQVENALKYATSLTGTLKTNSGETVLPDTDTSGSISSKDCKSESEKIADKDIYRLMLWFFAKNDDKLNVFPADIENIVRERIRTILEKKKLN